MPVATGIAELIAGKENYREIIDTHTLRGAH